MRILIQPDKNTGWSGNRAYEINRAKRESPPRWSIGKYRILVELVI
jgi:hypothetical protein